MPWSEAKKRMNIGALITSTDPSPLGSKFSEAHTLVGGQEAHEHWGLDHLDGPVTVGAEVLPGSVEVGVEVRGELLAGESLVGLEDLLGGVRHVGLAQPEGAGWLTTDLGSILEHLDWGSLLVGILRDHGSHEDVIGVSREVGDWESLVLAVGGAILNGVPGLVDGLLLKNTWELGAL